MMPFQNPFQCYLFEKGKNLQTAQSGDEMLHLTSSQFCAHFNSRQRYSVFIWGFLFSPFL